MFFFFFIHDGEEIWTSIESENYNLNGDVHKKASHSTKKVEFFFFSKVVLVFDSNSVLMINGHTSKRRQTHLFEGLDLQRCT